VLFRSVRLFSRTAGIDVIRHLTSSASRPTRSLRHRCNPEQIVSSPRANERQGQRAVRLCVTSCVLSSDQSYALAVEGGVCYHARSMGVAGCWHALCGGLAACFVRWDARHSAEAPNALRSKAPRAVFAAHEGHRGRNAIPHKTKKASRSVKPGAVRKARDTGTRSLVSHTA